MLPVSSRLVACTATSTIMGFAGLVLQHDRQLEAVAKVEEARRGRAHHQRQAGSRLALGLCRTGARLASTATTMTR